MEKWEIDINCDVGEGLGNEAKLFPYISSCNLACGAHAGNDETMMDVVKLALTHHVHIGAHPSYPDRENFGRKSIEMSPEAFKDSILFQIAKLDTMLTEHKVSLSHIKAHGALYNDLAKDRHLSKQYLEILHPYKNRTSLFVPYGSILAEEAESSGFHCTYEAFGDRNYNDDLSLVSRTSGLALLTDPREVFEHLILMIRKSTVKTITGRLIPIVANTYCVHGDTSSAYEILMYLSEEFPKHNIHLKK